MYVGAIKIFVRYWTAYGGLRALVRSPYLHLALALLALTANTWLNTKWWNDVINAMPSLLGFTLGGFAMFIGFGDERFRELLADSDEQNPSHPTIYVSLCSTFVHFIVIQILALLFAIVIKSFDFSWAALDEHQSMISIGNVIAGCIGYLLFLYALTSVLAATMHIFRIASMYETFQRAKKKSQQ